jgi:hypothetical protein
VQNATVADKGIPVMQNTINKPQRLVYVQIATYKFSELICLDHTSINWFSSQLGVVFAIII